MGDTLLSQSLVQNNEDSKLSRDPFQQAQNQYQAKQDPGVTLSSSPFSQPPQAQSQAPMDFGPMFQKLGIQTNNIQVNDLGRTQLVGRLQQKFGSDYSQNPDAVSALDAFDQKLKASGTDANKSMNQSLATANRTLSALLGGASGV
jgi:hypothetical protein